MDFEISKRWKPFDKVSNRVKEEIGRFFCFVFGNLLCLSYKFMLASCMFAVCCLSRQGASLEATCMVVLKLRWLTSTQNAFVWEAYCPPFGHQQLHMCEV